MAYATVSHVQAKTIGRPTYTATSPVTDTQVIEFLEDTAVEIDAILRARGYTVPVPTTATSALRLLQNGNTLGAAALVEAAAPVPHTSAEYARKLWEEFQKMLWKGGLELDLAKDAGEALPRHGTPAPPMFSVVCRDF